MVRTHLGHVCTAAALNFLRLGDSFTNLPRAKTPRAPFAKLMAGPVAACQQPNQPVASRPGAEEQRNPG